MEGATFKLYREINDLDEDGNKDTEYLVVSTTVDSETGKDINKVTDWTTDETEASSLISDEDGLFNVVGLDVGTYYLQETVAPTGYNYLKDPIKITIVATYNKTDSRTATDDYTTLNTLTAYLGNDSENTDNKLTTDKNEGTISETVANSAGTILPITGGIGTTIFYVIGTVLILGAAVLLVTRRRMGNME